MTKLETACLEAIHEFYDEEESRLLESKLLNLWDEDDMICFLNEMGVAFND